MPRHAFRRRMPNTQCHAVIIARWSGPLSHQSFARILGRVPSSARLGKGEAILSETFRKIDDLENGPLEFLHFLHAATKSDCKNYFLLTFFDGLPVRYPPAP